MTLPVSAAITVSANVSSALIGSVPYTSQAASQSLARNASITSSSSGYGNLTIAPTGTGLVHDYASSCNQQLLAWSEASSAAKQSTTINTTYTTTTTLFGENPSTSIAPATATLCDGVPRVIGGSTITGPTVYGPGATLTQTMSWSVSSWDYFTYGIPAPTCTINYQQCSSLYSVFLQDISATTSLQLPACTQLAAIESQIAASSASEASRFDTTSAEASSLCASCTISANGVQLSYWAPNIVGSPCAANRTTIPVTETKPGYPNSRVIGNMTYVSPTVYLGFTYVAAADGHAGYCGGVVSTTVIPLAPEDVSSVRFKQLDNCTSCHEGPNSYTMQGLYPVNYADFSPGMVPLAAYQGQPACVRGGCNTITEASYSPFLSVPYQLRSAQSVWSDCALFVDGIWDPPIPLQPVESEAGVTTSVSQGHPATSSYIPAEPVSTQGSPAASSTAPAATAPAPIAYSSTAAESDPSPSIYFTTTSPAVETISSPVVQSYSSNDPSDPESSAPPTSENNIAPSPAPYTTAITSSVQVVVVSSQGGQSEDPSGAAPASYSDPTTQQISPATTNALSILSAAETSNQDPAPAAASGQGVSAQDPGTQTSSQDPTIAPTSSEGLSAEDPSAPAPSTASQAVVIVQSSTYRVVQSGSVASIGSQELTVGGPPATIGDQTVSLASSGIVAQDSTIAFTAAPATTPPVSQVVVSIASSAYTVLQSGSVASIGNQQITVGAPPVTIGTQVVSLASSGIAIGDTTLAFTPAPTASQAVVSIADSAYTVLQSGSVASIGSQAITEGADPVTIGSQVVSLGSNGIVVGSSTVSFSAADPAQTSAVQAIIGVGTQSVTAYSTDGSVVIMDATAATTLAPNEAATFDGQAVSLASNGLVAGSSFVPFSTVAVAAPTAAQQAVITAGDHTISAVITGSSVVLMDGSSSTTVALGGTVTFDGQTLSPGSTEIAVVGGPTVPYSSVAAALSQAVVTEGGNTYTAVQSGNSIVVEGGSSTLTLTAGSAATLGGEVISALPGGTAIVVGGSTVPLTAAPALQTPAPTDEVITIGGQVYTALGSPQAGQSFVLEDSSSTVAIEVGAVQTVEGQVVSVLSNGAGLVIDGTSTVLLTSTAADPSVEVTVSGQTFTVIQESGVQVLKDATATVTLVDGQQTTFAGQSVSAASTGDIVVIDGSITKTLSAVVSTGSSLNTISGPAFTAATGPAKPTSSTKSAASNVVQRPTYLAVFWGTLLVLGAICS